MTLTEAIIHAEEVAEEIENAWRTNPDGAGYSIQKDGKVYFKRGFMKLKQFKKEIMPLIGKYNLLNKMIPFEYGGGMNLDYNENNLVLAQIFYQFLLT